ncbi:MAG: ABC transporter ATP-binding protein [Coriobacteriales bacterium]|nr:ABC transporter ATP-binding protein [Coriobacteriales bacterium]
MSEATQAHAWMPVATIDSTPFEELGYVTLNIELEGTPPKNVRYLYTWRSANGLERGQTDYQRLASFNFLPPHDGRFFLNADVSDTEGVIKSAGAWANIGDVVEDEFKRPPIPDDSVPVVIDVNDVSMVFNKASEQYNSLKEYFIALARHELNFKAFRALNHVSFSVRRGEAFGLVGTNGSGKSTMLKIIAGVLEASEGTCTVTGSIAPLIELGAGFDMELTARENIYLNGALLGYRKEFIDEHITDIIAFAELEDFMDMPLKNYSSGMVARIAFAIATVAEPDILIVDETLSVGDFLFQQKCQRRIQELIGSGNVTVLLVSHSIEIVEAMCDRVCWIEKGQQRMTGPTDDVCAAYRNLGQ